MKRLHIKKLISYLKPYGGGICLVFISIIISQACALMLPALMSDIVDIGIKQRGAQDVSKLTLLVSETDILRSQTNYILKTGLVMLGVSIVSLLFTLYIDYLVAKISAGISFSLRDDVFKKIMSFSYKDFTDFSASSLINRATSDVENVKSLVITMTQIFIPPIMMAGSIIMAMRKSVSLSWMIALGSVISVIVLFICFKTIMPKLRLIQNLSDKFNLITKERLLGVIPVRIFGTSFFEEERFKSCNSELVSISLFVNKVTAFMSPVLTITMNIISLIIIWLGASEINAGTMHAGDIIAFLQYSVMAVTAFLMLSFMIAVIPRALISVERVFEVLDKKSPDSASCVKTKLNSTSSKNLEVRNLYFKYDNADDYILKDISFSVKPGNVLGVIGSTGCGKSTLIELICSLRNPTQGEILYGGCSVFDLSKEDFVSKIGYVPQRSMLFSGDLTANFKIADENVSNEQLWKALKIAQAADFVRESGHGLEMAVTALGSNFSGGQRQRIAIARAIAKNPEIYVFDDSFSSLDFKTELALRTALSEHFDEHIVIISSQRISTIKNASQILVLEEGRAAGLGSHENLIKECSLYREMAELQLGGEIAL